MALSVKLPPYDLKKEYSLFIKSKIIYLNKVNEFGTLVICEGCGIAFYSASNSRRALIFAELSENDYSIPLQEGKLPYFKQNVRVLYKASGRKIDLLKFMCYNLEKKYGNKIYELGTVYWLTLGSFIDSIRPLKKHTGKNSNKRQIYMITDKFIKKRIRINENL